MTASVGKCARVAPRSAPDAVATAGHGRDRSDCREIAGEVPNACRPPAIGAPAILAPVMCRSSYGLKRVNRVVGASLPAQKHVLPPMQSASVCRRAPLRLNRRLVAIAPIVLAGERSGWPPRHFTRKACRNEYADDW